MIPSDLLGSLRLPLVAEMTRLQVRVVCSYAKRVQSETRWKWREGRCAFASWSCSITKPVVSNTPLMVVQTSFYLTLHLAFLSVRAVATPSRSSPVQSRPCRASSCICSIPIVPSIPAHAVLAPQWPKPRPTSLGTRAAPFAPSTNDSSTDRHPTAFFLRSV